jgi:hypothetical protein
MEEETQHVTPQHTFFAFFGAGNGITLYCLALSPSSSSLSNPGSCTVEEVVGERDG